MRDAFEASTPFFQPPRRYRKAVMCSPHTPINPPPRPLARASFDQGRHYLQLRPPSLRFKGRRETQRRCVGAGLDSGTSHVPDSASAYNDFDSSNIKPRDSAFLKYLWLQYSTGQRGGGPPGRHLCPSPSTGPPPTPLRSKFTASGLIDSSSAFLRWRNHVPAPHPPYGERVPRRVYETTPSSSHGAERHLTEAPQRRAMAAARRRGGETLFILRFVPPFELMRLAFPWKSVIQTRYVLGSAGAQTSLRSRFLLFRWRS